MHVDDDGLIRVSSEPVASQSVVGDLRAYSNREMGATSAAGDPEHSRRFDVHRWSDHPEVRALTDELWAEYFAYEFEPQVPIVDCRLDLTRDCH